MNECRGSAEARLHTEHGSGLLNDHANWLRSAPPEPRTVPTKSETALHFFALTVTENEGNRLNLNQLSGETASCSKSFGQTGGGNNGIYMFGATAATQLL